MKKKLLLTLLFSFSISYAGVVNWVVALVNNEPITNNEVYSTMKAIGADQKNAIEFLIKEKLKAAEIKRMGIAVSPFEINNHIAEIAKNNGQSVEDLQKNLSKQGISYTNFQQDIADQIKEQKFLETIFANSDKKATPENVRIFYEQNKNSFTTFESINVTRFASDKESDIQRIANGGKIGNTFNHKIKLNKSQLDDRTAQVFSSIPDGGFTPMIRNPKGYFEIFRIDSKVGLQTMPFEQVEQQVINEYVMQNRRKSIEDYFERLRTEAVIEFLPAKN